MTRKEELKGRASKFMEVQDRYPYRTSIDMLHAELLQVEREVWSRINARMAMVVESKDALHDWLRTQQQELT